MSSYYYLVSSLPSLQIEAAPPISCDEFIQMCSDNLNSKDYEVLTGLIEGNTVPYSNETVSKWREFSGALRYELALQRAERMGIKDTSAYINTEFSFPFVKDVVSSAVSNSSPFDGEIILDEYRFAYLEELGMNHYFDLTAIIVYYLKLQILERKTAFDFDSGDAEFKRLLSNIQTSIKSY